MRGIFTMRISTFDIDEFVEINELQEVTSPVLFERGGVPHPQGLVSNQIFGINTKDRRETFAYIDLHGHFFHPHMLKAFRRMFRNIDKIISGSDYFSINENGQLVRDENGNTGIEWLYKNWDKIKWERTEGMRNQRIDLLTKSPKKEIFMTKQIVIPAFYRDINSNTSRGGGDTVPINDMYSKLIRMCSLIRDEAMFSFSFNSTIMRIQDLIVDIYDYFKEKIEKKAGLIRKYLMGKSVDYSGRVVITAPTFHGNTLEDNMVTYEYSAVPMAYCCVLFFPFIQHWLREFFDNNFIRVQNAIEIFKSDGSTEIVSIVNPESYYSDKYIEKMITRFTKSPEIRFDPIKIPTEKGLMNATLKGYYYDENNPSNDSSIFTRPLTITDLLFMACEDVVKDKHIMVTRYPVLSFHAEFFSRIRVSSTLTTEPAMINGHLYRWYPKVEIGLVPDMVVTRFNDTLKFSNSYLPGIVGDYDGDQVTVKGIWSLEANREAEKIMVAPSNFLDGAGQWVRGCNNEAVQTMYGLTKNPK